MENILESSSLGLGPTLIIILIIVWSIAWKGVALWKSARNGKKIWFIVLLIVNTIGVLDIIYIFLISKRGKKEVQNKNTESLNN